MDKRFSKEIDSSKTIQDLEKRSQAHLREWCLKRGRDYAELTEEDFVNLVEKGIKEIRNSQG